MGLLAWSVPASASRPFDGTDAAVAAKGELEIELQPAGRLARSGWDAGLIAPATVINYGFKRGWEPFSFARARCRFRRRALRA